MDYMQVLRFPQHNRHGTAGSDGLPFQCKARVLTSVLAEEVVLHVWKSVTDSSF